MTAMSDNADFASFAEGVPADLPEKSPVARPAGLSVPEELAALSFSLWLM